MKENTILSIDLAHYVNQSYANGYRLHSDIKDFWIIFLEQIQILLNYNSDYDFSEFNSQIDLGDEPLIPKISFDNNGSNRFDLDAKNINRLELDSKNILKKGNGKVNRNLTPKSSRETTLPEKYMKRSSGHDDPKKPGIPHKIENKPSDKKDVYFIDLLKRRKDSLSYHDDEIMAINSTITNLAFEQTIQDQKAPPDLITCLLQDYITLKTIPAVTEQSSSQRITSVEFEKNQPQIESSINIDLEEPGDHKPVKVNEKESDTNSTGFHLLSELTQSVINKSSFEMLPARAKHTSIFNDTDSSFIFDDTDSSLKKLANFVQKEDVKNLINLNVHMSGNETKNEDLENIAEKVNRILWEQAERYGIDLT